MPYVTGRLKAYPLLAFAFATTVLSRWLHAILGLVGIRFGRRYGLAAFKRNYAPDGLNAMREGDETILLGAARCIACGRCERVRTDTGAGLPVFAPERVGLMTLVLATTRATPDAVEALEGWRTHPDDELERAEAVCPTRVPLRRLAEFVTYHAALSEARTSAHE